MQVQQPWWNYALLALWPIMTAAVVLGALALWRIGTAMRKIAFQLERPPTHMLPSIQAAQAAMSEARVLAGRSPATPAIVFEPPPTSPPAPQP